MAQRHVTSVMSRYTIVLDPEDYNERLGQATPRHAARATWLLIALAALALLSFDFATDDADATACRQRLIAPESYALDPDAHGERIDRLDWDREGYERSATGGRRTSAPPCPS
nr:hypothetical protein [uncultured Dongia sp.]